MAKNEWRWDNDSRCYVMIVNRGCLSEDSLITLRLRLDQTQRWWLIFDQITEFEGRFAQTAYFVRSLENEDELNAKKEVDEIMHHYLYSW